MQYTNFGKRALKNFPPHFIRMKWPRPHPSFSKRLAFVRSCASTSFLFLLLLPVVVFAYTSPGKPVGFVNDFAGLIAPAERTALEGKLSGFAQASGNKIVMTTIATLGGDTIENFANELFNEWEIGKKGADNGALILIARDERKVRIEVGYGLEPVLTDAIANAIIRTNFTPHFASGDFAGGLNAGIDEMSKVIYDSEAPVAPEQNGTDWVSSDFLFILFFIPLWLGSILGRSKSWWAGGVVGSIVGITLGFLFGFLYVGVAAIAVLIPVGLLFDFIVSRAYARSVGKGLRAPWWIGGGGGGHGSFGGGFGGFGGGSSGGGGASGSY